MKKASNFFSWIWKKTKHNWGLKLLSLFFAIVLYYSAVIQENPEVTRTYDNIPVTVVGDQQFKEKDLALVKSISSSVTTARVTIKINRNDVADFDESSIPVQLDLSRIPGVGTHEIKLISASQNVEKIYPETVTVEVDERANRVIPVECEVVGTLPEGYHRSALTVSPNAIQVSGAKSIVDKIEKGYLRLDLTDRIESVSSTKEYTFIDKNGSAIDASSLEVSFDSVVLEMGITPKKSVLITPLLFGQDKIKEGYQISDVTIEPSTVEVTGNAELMEGLTSVQLLGIDITGAFENVLMQDLDIQVPEGITLLGTSKASLLVEIEEIMAEKSFEGVAVELRNIPEGLTPVEFEALIDIVVTAPRTVIDNIAANHITLYVDMTGAKSGETTLPILYESPEEYKVKGVTYSQDTVIVTLE